MVFSDAPSGKPEPDALGMLGTGQFGNTDPAQKFQEITHAFEPAAEPLSQLDGVLQGAAATAAGATTSAALSDGFEAAGQPTGLRENLPAAAAIVKQTEARPMVITNDFGQRLQFCQQDLSLRHRRGQRGGHSRRGGYVTET